MRVKSAEQYKALRARELRKRQGKKRKTRRDREATNIRAIEKIFGLTSGDAGHGSKPQHGKRVSNGSFTAASPCADYDRGVSHYAHANGLSMCPGYLASEMSATARKRREEITRALRKAVKK